MISFGFSFARNTCHLPLYAKTKTSRHFRFATSPYLVKIENEFLTVDFRLLLEFWIFNYIRIHLSPLVVLSLNQRCEGKPQKCAK